VQRRLTLIPATIALQKVQTGSRGYNQVIIRCRGGRKEGQGGGKVALKILKFLYKIKKFFNILKIISILIPYQIRFIDSS
jgi:hypothetical protein